MTINDVVKKVVDGVNPSWPTLHKIRYVYLSLGKLLKKDTDFFFSVDNKLADKNMSIEDIKRIYEDNKDNGDIKIICRSAAYILQKVYDELGIKSTLVKSNNNVINYESDEKNVTINHWFLAVYDDNGKAYFLTLASDLPYIQMGMQTRHFATNIPYKKIAKNGEEIQVYYGDEIKHTVLTDKDLRPIDLDLGYINLQYKYDENYRQSRDWHYNYSDAGMAMLSSELKTNNFYYELEEQNTKFYDRVTKFKSGDREISFMDDRLDSLSKEDWNNWIKIVCRFVHRKIEKIIQYRIFIDVYYDSPEWNFDDWIREICVQIQRYLYQFVPTTDESLYINGDFNFSSWSRKMKKATEVLYNGIDYENILVILGKTNVLANMVLKTGLQKNFSNILNSLASHFVKQDYVLEKSLVDGIVSSKYIANKFRTLFKKIFSCNEELNDFNEMDYSEQIVIIKMILERMFPELNKNNGIIGDWFNEKYSVVQNRIQIYSVKHKKTDRYAIVFHIFGDSTFNDTYYFYDPKNNKFGVANILRINSEYIIVSDRFKTRIEEIEEIEEKKNKM